MYGCPCVWILDNCCVQHTCGTIWCMVHGVLNTLSSIHAMDDRLKLDRYLSRNLFRSISRVILINVNAIFTCMWSWKIHKYTF